MTQPAKLSDSVFDIMDQAHEATLDAQAEADRQAGRTIEDEAVREWLQALARSEILPPPQR